MMFYGRSDLRLPYSTRWGRVCFLSRSLPCLRELLNYAIRLKAPDAPVMIGSTGEGARISQIG